MTALRLTRSRQDVQSFLSVLGGLRETRLTAVLGFLVSRFPEKFGPLLGFVASPADEISVEESGDGDRYDVLIRASGEKHIIEGKIGPKQNVDQLLRYIRSRHFSRKPSLTVVDNGSALREFRQREFHAVRRRVKKLRFVTWADVALVCQGIIRLAKNFQNDRVGAVIAQEFCAHLKENNMTIEPQPEIYLRDVGTTHSVELYFKHNIYKCQPNFYNSARGNRYFAPYFTRQMADQIRERNLVPVGEGISFVSQVEIVQVMKKGDVLEFLKKCSHSDPKSAAELVRKEHKQAEVLMLMLGTPRLMFVSPVTKAKLARAGLRFGQGAMGARSCTFDDLFAAAQS